MSSRPIPKCKLQKRRSTICGIMARTPSLPEYDKLHVGERLRLIRKAKKLKQNLLADMIGGGVTPQKLSNYESGRDLIPVHVAARLCAVTGANFDYLYRGMMGGLPADMAQAIAALQRQSSPAARRA